MFGRIANLIRGFVSLFIKGVERGNPEALLELEQENLRKQVGNFNQGLAAHAGLCERLMGQVRKLESEENDLRAKVTAHLRAGNRGPAGQYALRLQTVERELGENRTQLGQAEDTYKNLIKARDVAVSSARAKIEGLKGAINDMRMKQAMAEIHEMSAGMVTSIGGSGDTLSRLHEMVEEERTKAAGRARVAQGRDRHGRREGEGGGDERARRPGARGLRRARRACAARLGSRGRPPRAPWAARRLRPSR